MKILLNGATAGSNFGDFIFAKMFQDVVSEHVGFENVYWYNSRFTFSKFYSSLLKNEKKYKLRDIDALIYISGGYFCGNDKKITDYIFRYLNYFHIGMRCILRKIPYAIVGVEVGHSKSRIVDCIQRIILKKAEFVVVRNQESYEVLKEYGVECKHCTSDSVFAMNRDVFSQCCVPEKIETCKKKILFLHVNPIKSQNEVIKSKIIPALNMFLSKHKEYAVLISADQYSSGESEMLEDISSKICCENILTYSYKNPMCLCKVLDRCDFVITTKLHVGIVGMKLSKSVVSFSGHTVKISRLYQQLNESDRTRDLQTLNDKECLDILERYHDIPVLVSNEIVEAALSNFELLKNFLGELEK